jgi:hypothetical protein
LYFNREYDVTLGNKLFYCIIGLALLLFVAGFLSMFNVSTTVVDQARLWQETERPLIRQPVAMKPGNRWDAEFGEILGKQSGHDLSEIYELVGVVDSEGSHALIRIKDPTETRRGEVIRVTLGADLAGGVKVTHIEESRITLRRGDERTVLALYQSSERENEQAMEKRVDSQR